MITNKITVLMSTYNGEKYLAEQIDSILGQKGVEVKLIIRDDGSIDKTRDILSSFERNRKVEVIFGDNLGYTQSFLKLMTIAKNCESDYFAFSDQDDVWKRKKLYSAVQKLNNSNKGMYYSDLQFTNENLNITSRKSYSKYRKNFESAMCMSSVAGCTMVFDKRVLTETLKIDLEQIPDVVGHDGIVYRVSMLLDYGAIYDKRSYILFRRTNSNTSNASSNFFDKFKTAVDIFTKFNGYQSKLADILFETYHDQVDKKKQVELLMMAKYKNSFRKKMQLFFSRKVITGITRIDCIVKLSILFNKY